MNIWCIFRNCTIYILHRLCGVNAVRSARLVLSFPLCWTVYYKLNNMDALYTYKEGYPVNVLFCICEAKKLNEWMTTGERNEWTRLKSKSIQPTLQKKNRKIRNKKKSVAGLRKRIILEHHMWTELYDSKNVAIKIYTLKASCWFPSHNSFLVYFLF